MQFRLGLFAATGLLALTGIFAPVVPVAAQPPAPAQTVRVTITQNRLVITGDGTVYLILDNARRPVTPFGMSDDEINALPQGDPFNGVLAPISATTSASTPAPDLRENRIVVRSDNALFIIQGGLRHAISPLSLTDDELNAFATGAPVTALVPADVAASMQTSTQAANTVATVNVTEKEWSITPDLTIVPAGDVTFVVNNTGQTDHEMQVIKSTQDPKNLPQSKVHGEIDEAAVGDKAGEIEGILGGTTETDTFTLTPGTYVLFCNVSGHYAKGMVATIKVK